MDIRDEQIVTGLGDPLLRQRAIRPAVAPDAVDVELLFTEHRRRLVNLAAGAPEARFFMVNLMVNLPGGPISVTVDWLGADGSELGGELAEAAQPDVGVDTTVSASVG